MSAASGLIELASQRRRRSAEAIDELRAAIFALLADDNPQTVRQVFYALVVRALIAKTEGEYNSTVVSLMSQMRRSGALPYDWLADNTRWMRKPQSYRGLADFLDRNARFYRRSMWAELDVYVEIWCEKDALAGVLLAETAAYDVPLMVSRGFSSDTFLHSAGEAIATQGKPAFVYQFGDHDTSGVLIGHQIEAGLRRHAGGAEIHFERIAVTPQQIRDMSLPSRPTKRAGNTHAYWFVGDSVELDAIPAAQLRAVGRDCIARHLDPDVLDRLRNAEDSERMMLRRWASDVAKPRQ
jgi:hypothetical protein